MCTKTQIPQTITITILYPNLFPKTFIIQCHNDISENVSEKYFEKSSKGSVKYGCMCFGLTPNGTKMLITLNPRPFFLKLGKKLKRQRETKKLKTVALLRYLSALHGTFMC